MHERHHKTDFGPLRIIINNTSDDVMNMIAKFIIME